MKHTQGPWIVTHNGYANYPYVIRDADYVGLAEVFCDESPDQPVQTANARLIAAAPEMLEALKYLQKHYELLGTTGEFKETLDTLITKVGGI